MIQLVPSTLLNSFNLNIPFDANTSKMLKLLGLSLPNDNLNDIITSVGAYLDTKFVAYKNLTLSFAETDFKKLFDITIEKALLGMFKVNN